MLLKAGYLHPSNKSLCPLILVYINQGNTIKALEAFELICEKYKYAHAFTVLTKSIVLAEDASLLQRFIDVAIKVHKLT
ncbi:hypothetical protein KPH14_010828 [Odynerus spinipes]|uniref:Uncharacterized protein n=1 Tax=Odynerus spinipes TaxID=1348599 RepID=A0AAD9RGV4_9HYME|nr:hypothetical protein KPH14_010828 [Odynerus spinipes]